MKTVEQLESELQDAKEARVEINRAMFKEVTAARTAIEQSYAARLHAASEVIHAASVAFVDARNAKAQVDAKSHPLVGKKMVAMRKPRNASWYAKVRPTYGVVEIVTTDSPQPEGRSNKYHRLPVGTLAIRILGANGRPGKTLERLVLREDKRAQFEREGLDLEKEAMEARLQHFWA